MQVHELITALLKVDGALEVEIEVRSTNDLLLIDNVKSDCTAGRRRLLIETIEK